MHLIVKYFSQSVVLPKKKKKEIHNSLSNPVLFLELKLFRIFH